MGQQQPAQKFFFRWFSLVGLHCLFGLGALMNFVFFFVLLDLSDLSGFIYRIPGSWSADPTTKGGGARTMTQVLGARGHQGLWQDPGGLGSLVGRRSVSDQTGSRATRVARNLVPGTGLW